MGLAEFAVIFVLFAEPGFPSEGFEPPAIELPGAIVADSIAALEGALKPGRVLVWRHGGAYPAEAWPAIEQFLSQGGSLLHLGGPIFSHPVEGEPGARRVAAAQVSVAKHLGLNPGGTLPVAGGRQLSLVSNQILIDPLPVATIVSLIEPRFSDAKIRPDEEGSPGHRDAVLRPISHLQLAGDDLRFPAAAASVAIDRLRGRFAGGRWVLRLLSSAPTEGELTELVRIAERPPLELRVALEYASFHEQERPSAKIILDRPAADHPATGTALEQVSATVEILPSDGGETIVSMVTLPAKKSVAVGTEFAVTTPGFHRIRVTLAGEPIGGVVESGFWIFDPALFSGGEAVTIAGDQILRGGVPEVGIGTTVMSRSVHREFLEKPNPGEWDQTFAELASLGVRWVRTGVWSGWGEFVHRREIDESWLRALEAYYLCARRHDIGVIFTFFSFHPPSFEGRSPYFESPSLTRQAFWLSTVAKRFAPARTIIWDLINEPSFADPERNWFCRPNGDRSERQAFFRWLEETFEPEGPRTWLDVVRERWRLRPDEPIRVPIDADFSDRIVFESARPYRARDYIRFASYAFSDWTERMRGAIRDAGSNAPITVGQDEGGLNDRPSPLFHQDAVEFTSIHTWWYDDAQLWDVVMARVPGKPCWVTETLLMRREHLSGEIFRTPAMRMHIFARKLALPFAAGATHVFTWAYDVNPYMDSDNEVSIGLRRVDGSYTPEHRVFRSFSTAFPSRRASLLPPSPPTVTVLFPTHDHRTPRDLLRSGTQRLVNILFELGHRVRVVHEERAGLEIQGGETVVLPSCRGILESAWRRIAPTGSGAPAQVICSGFFERDDVGLPARRLGGESRAVAPTESVGERTVTFSLAVQQSASAAEVTSGRSTLLGWRAPAPGFLQHPLPIDFCEGTDVVRDLYREVLGAPDPTPAGVFVVPLLRRTGEAWVVVSQRGSPVRLERAGLDIEVDPEGAAIVWRDGDGDPVVSGVGVRASRREPQRAKDPDIDSAPVGGGR